MALPTPIAIADANGSPLQTHDAYSLSRQTGTIAAALAQDSVVFAMRLSPSWTEFVQLTRLRLHWTTIVAFTTPITANRRISVFRGDGAAATGGTAFTGMFRKSTGGLGSGFAAANGGDVRASTNAALGVVGIVLENVPAATLHLTGNGTAGSSQSQSWNWESSSANPIILQPGQLLAVQNPVAMDAAGTWQLLVEADWREIPISPP